MKTTDLELVTVKTFTFAHDVALVRNYLESEGIRCFVKDELTVQVHPFTSAAIGGVKLQVCQPDVERAVQLLKDGGYLKDEDLEPSKFQVNLYLFLSKIPLIKNIYK